MSNQPPQDDIIAPIEAPLSHLTQNKRGVQRLPLDRRGQLMVGGIAVLAIIALVLLPSMMDDTTTPSIDTAAPSASALTDNGAAASADSTNKTQLAPFAQAQQTRARELVQAELSKFVELQIQLEDNMQVGAWGEQELANAMALAQQGDAEFVAENFSIATELYQQAVAKLDALIAQGNQLFSRYVEQANARIDGLDPEAAAEAIAAALVIKPDDVEALAIQARAAQLPEIISLLRTAKNHELSERFVEALAVYDEIAQLDPKAPTLAQRRAEARAAQSGNNLTAHISRGFSALDNEQFETARKAFNAALSIDPNNDVAKGGLQQVAKQNDLAIIKQQRLIAERAINQEQWQTAIDAYQQVLDLDNNIQFAKNGKSTALAHQKSQQLLSRISSEPSKLSSEKLYLDAIDILDRARKLNHLGPSLNASIAEVSRLITLYRDPVDVVLLSDNATDIIVSNVGKLGVFERKTLSLRPGQYTIRGSQSGCRDIYMSVDVLPGIAPLDLSCPESVAR